MRSISGQSCPAVLPPIPEGEVGCPGGEEKEREEKHLPIQIPDGLIPISGTAAFGGPGSTPPCEPRWAPRRASVCCAATASPVWLRVRRSGARNLFFSLLERADHTNLYKNIIKI